ncbi:MAG: NfeD family protein [Sphingobacteriia bacterium]|nr:NfeD family protein [Sphingobacteriia bacterium]NCC40112.1 NfeD family protein [Gammaproteobacteria bacterium]
MIDWTFTPASLWILVGVLLILSEFALPGVIAIFFGIAALLVGLLLYLSVPLDLSGQILLVGVLGALLLLVARRRMKPWFMGQSATGGTGSEVLPPGTRAVAQEDFVGGRGVVLLNGVRWSAESTESIRAGDPVWLTGHQGLILRVSANPPASS